MISSMNTKTATIQFSPKSIDTVLDQLVACLDAAGYPLIEANLEDSTITVNSASDHDEISVVLAAQDAVIDCGASVGIVMSVEL